MTEYRLPRPADNVEAVRDANGKVWWRDSHPNRRASFWTGPEDEILTWTQLLTQRGPLTDKERENIPMNLCSCCYDEITGTWCGCMEQHEQDSSIMEQARDYLRGPRDMEMGEQWSYYCSACSRYTSGDVYYIDN